MDREQLRSRIIDFLARERRQSTATITDATVIGRDAYMLLTNLTFWTNKMTMGDLAAVERMTVGQILDASQSGPQIVLG